MAKQDIVRSKLDSKVFTPYGKVVTLLKKLSPTYTSGGELEGWLASTSSITVVPYNILDNRRLHENPGSIESGEMQMAVRYDVDIDPKDVITLEGVDWEVSEVEKNYLPDNVVTIVSVVKVLP
jgi:hypothetical protein